MHKGNVFNVRFNELVRGASAYEVAVRNGFKGTEAEWIASLEQGAKDAEANAKESAESAREYANDAYESAQKASASELAVAEKAEQIAAEKAETTSMTEENRSNTAKVIELAGQVATDREKVTSSAEQVATDAEQIATDKETVKTLKETVVALAEQVAVDKKSVSENATQVLKDKNSVAADKETVESLASQVKANKETVVALAEQVTADKKSVSENAEQVATNAEQTANNKNLVTQLAEQVQANTAKTEILTKQAEQYANDAKNEVQSDWGENDETKSSYVKNRTHYEEMEYIYPETTISPYGKGLYAELYPVNEMFTFEEGKEYTIVFNGKAYKAVVEKWDDENYSGIYYVGMKTEDFSIVQSAYYETVLKTTKTALEVKNYTGEDCTIGVKEAVIHYLNPKYIKDMYYTEESSGEVAEIVPLSTYKVDEDEGYFAISNFTAELIADASYTVTWNGVEYECVATDLSSTVGSDIIAIGSYQLFFEEENAEYPFCIMQGTDEESNSFMMLCYVIDGSTQVALSVTGASTEIVHKIDSKYLPDIRGDWSVNDPNDIAYVKNRTHYTNVTVAGEVLAEQEITGYTNEQLSVFVAYLATSSLTIGNTYIIKFNGEMYTCDARVGITENAGHYGWDIGNRSLLYSDYEDTGEPFYIEYEWSNDTTLVFPEKYSDTITLGIYNTEVWVKRLDEKYLPETVDSVIIRSSTQDSTKKFKITVDDTGTISATEVTE